ncbi:hypothetical protein A2U01_0093587, partial [Trifolium medium]|nr:hypothetical protein [Trifolium medium]
IFRHWSIRAVYVIRITVPRLIITKRQVRKEERKWGVESRMVEEEGDPMKVVVAVDEEAE